MDRRPFVSALLHAALGATLSPALARAAPSGRAAGVRPRHWAWVQGGRERTPEEWRGRFARVRAAGIEGVLVSGGDPAGLAELARAEGLAFHRWIWTLNRSGDRWVKATHPEWFTVSREGASSLERPPYVGYYQWLCPTRAEVRTYLRGLMADVARAPGVDGVHLDYVRHADVILPRGLWARYRLVQDRELPQFDFCYCDACRSAFRARHGRDPLALADPAGDAAWRAFRWESVTALVRELADAVHAEGKVITAAVFPTPTIARRLVRQDWASWPLDAVFPMLYHRFYEEDLAWIGEGVREGVRALPRGRPLYAGLYVPDLPPDELARAVDVARRRGAAGVALFTMDALSDAHLERLRAAIGG